MAVAPDTNLLRRLLNSRVVRGTMVVMVVMVIPKTCTTDIYLHIDARMADYIRTHP